MKPERGAEPVATIAALPFHEVLLIGALRARCDGPDEMAIFAQEHFWPCRITGWMSSWG